MASSIAKAYEEAMAKKTKGKSKGGSGGLVHPSFPPQGDAQPSFMGSQSAPPGPGGGPMDMGAGPQMDPSGQFGGGGY